MVVTTATIEAPTRRCTHPTGCDKPALDGRWYCHHHAQRLEQRAAELINKDAHKGRT